MKHEGRQEKILVYLHTNARSQVWCNYKSSTIAKYMCVCRGGVFICLLVLGRLSQLVSAIISLITVMDIQKTTAGILSLLPPPPLNIAYMVATAVKKKSDF